MLRLYRGKKWTVKYWNSTCEIILPNHHLNPNGRDVDGADVMSTLLLFLPVPHIIPNRTALRESPSTGKSCHLYLKVSIQLCLR